MHQLRKTAGDYGTAFLGTVGPDEAADFFVSEMAIRRVHPVLEVIPAMLAGACAVLAWSAMEIVPLAGVPEAAAAASQD